MEMHGIMSVLRHQNPPRQNFQMSDLLTSCMEEACSVTGQLKGPGAGGYVTWWFKGWT